MSLSPVLPDPGEPALKDGLCPIRLVQFRWSGGGGGTEWEVSMVKMNGPIRISDAHVNDLSGSTETLPVIWGSPSHRAR